MAKLKLLSAALLAAVAFAAPAMAREHHVTRHGTNNAYISSDPTGAYDAVYPGYSNGAYAYRCVPAPRVGQFAGGPWTNDVACEPGSGNGAAY
jgi:hypothetical protein